MRELDPIRVTPTTPEWECAKCGEAIAGDLPLGLPHDCEPRAAVSHTDTRYEGRGNFPRCSVKGCKRKTDRPGEPCLHHRAIRGEV